MRAQQGTSSLRAILYMDEIFGYMPPVANPPSKRLFLTLLKQARAYGLGLVLATQNPVDLDYKGLSNTGTWFIGRLQTERDQARIMDGLEGVAAGKAFDRKAVEQTLAGLGKRRFLLHNVHEDEDVVFGTRWVMSYLAGPMTRDQIRSLTKKERATIEKTAADRVPPTKKAGSASSDVPVLPPSIDQLFVEAPEGDDIVYHPRIMAAGEWRFSSARYDVDHEEEGVFAVEADEGPVAVDWDHADEMEIDADALRENPEPASQFAELPDALRSAKAYTKWQREFKTWLRQNRTLTIYRSSKYKLASAAGESEGDFRARLQLSMNEKRDQTIAKLRKRYATKATTLENRLMKAEQRIDAVKQQSTQSKIDTALSFGTAILGAVLGRKRLSSTTANKVGTAMRRASASRKKSGDVKRAKETADKVRQDLAALNAELEREVDTLESAYDAQIEALKEIPVRAKSTDIQVAAFGLAWLPYRKEGKRFVAAWK